MLQEIMPKVLFVLALLAPVHQHHHRHPQEPDPQPVTTTWTPPPTPPASTQVKAGALTATQVASYARAAGFPESVIPTMVAIAWRESNWCPTAVYGYGCAGEGHAYAGGPSCGLWQLYPCPGPSYLDPAINAAGAYAKYVAS